MNLFDSSALLCFLQGERGSDAVERVLEDGKGVVSAVNWSEVAQKVRVTGGEWTLARGLLINFGIEVEPVTVRDAESAAALWRKGCGLSLADRVCLATGQRLVATVWTADTAWGESEQVRQVR
ncbi:MAG: type II toxin-antitoxin system VapC family toxin [Actinomycetia bacterium]|nr:type II toxin-antitoxin system VapC family toxin [Actinomycetes bacterium]